MEINSLIDEYTRWLRTEIKFEKIGEFYEISTPFMDNNNDYIVFYVRLDNDSAFFTDDGYTINQLKNHGIQMNSARKKSIQSILKNYGTELINEEIVLKADLREFSQRKHMYIQSIMKVDDLFMLAKNKRTSNFADDIQSFFEQKGIFYSDNVQFTGISGFSHNYEFLLQRSSNNPERLCRVMNTPSKNNMGNILFAWNDTKPARKPDSQLIVWINDQNTISKGVEEGFENYNTKVIKWSEKNSSKSIEMLSA